MQQFSNYLTFTSDDFASDESFQAYVYRTSTEDVMHWENFYLLYPEKRQEMQEATQLLTMLAPNKFTSSEEHKEAERTRLHTLLKAGKIFPVLPLENTHDDRKKWYQSWIRIAASVAFLLFIAVAFYFYTFHFGKKQNRYSTTFGAHRSVILPDSTRVTLNGNTTLTHFDNWDPQQVREVWVKGEAFFEVSHKRANAGNATFVVHAGGLDVSVLGTEFNVYNRDKKIKVILNTGKVNVSINAQNEKSSVTLSPGEALEYVKDKNKATKQKVNTNVLTSWRKKVLIFEDTQLLEIGEIIRDVYGFNVVFEDTLQAKQRISGTLPSNNVDVLLKALSKTSNLEIVKKGDEITLRNKVEESGSPENEKQSNE